MTDILIYAAHPDDEVLGAGGYIATMTQRGAIVVEPCAGSVRPAHARRDFDALAWRR